MEMIEIITKSGKETKKLGEKLAQEIIYSRDGSLPAGEAGPTSIKRALVVSLEGELGAGKTTFTQGFANGLGIEEKPKSPTFVIMRIYHPPPLLTKEGIKGRFSNFIHIDAYRITTKDLKILGWDEFIKKPENIILVEWGDILKKAMPRKAIRILFEHIGRSQSRLIKIIQ